MIRYFVLMLSCASAFAAPPSSAPPPKKIDVAPYVSGRTCEIQRELRGELNGDKREDAVLILAERDLGFLLVLVADSAGGYTRAGFTQVGNIAELELKKNVVSFTMYGGGTQLSNTTIYRIRWDPKERRMRVIGVDYSQENVGRGDFVTYEMSTNFLTGLQVRTSWDTEGSENVKVEKRTKGSPQTFWLEDFGDAPTGEGEY